MFANLPKLSQAAAPKDAFTQFNGGLDLETPSLLRKPGTLRDALNYEIGIEGGYRDLRGYERFDGRPKPSDADFMAISTSPDGTDYVLIVPGATITGLSSGATAVVASFIVTATINGTPTDGFTIVTKITGTFQALEIIRVSGTPVGSIRTTPYLNSASSSLLAAQYRNLAADIYRADIAAVTGQGNIRGGFTLLGVKYAMRDKVGGVTAGLYRATVAGWVEVTIGREVAFTSGGTYEIVDGDVVTGATSGATATVRRIQLVSGDWTTGDAAGYLTLYTQAGTFQAETLNVGANINVSTVAGNSTASTFAPGGRLEYDIDDFADVRGGDRMYGADGVNPGFEFDGTYVAFVHTGMVNDKPTHVKVHKKKLFLSFGGSNQHSGEGDPFAWEVVLGDGEIATGGHVTGYQVQPGDAGSSSLLIACRQRFYTLYGNDVTDWNLVEFRKKVGAYEWTLQSIASTICLDDIGLIDYQTVQQFGNFEDAELTAHVHTYVQSKKALAQASCVVRDKNQYRLMFSDKSGIIATLSGKKLVGIMPILLADQPVVMWSEEDTGGTEEVFFGASDGFVYQMERGTSFDGDPIAAYIITNPDHAKAIQRQKHYFSPATIEASGEGYAEIDFAYQFDYGAAGTPQPNSQIATIGVAASVDWDSGLTWDSGVTFDGSAVLPSIGLDLRGEGENVAWVIRKNSDYFEPMLLTGVHYRWAPSVSRKA